MEQQLPHTPGETVNQHVASRPQEQVACSGYEASSGRRTGLELLSFLGHSRHGGVQQMPRVHVQIVGIVSLERKHLSCAELLVQLAGHCSCTQCGVL